jgi:hypothetical protein
MCSLARHRTSPGFQAEAMLAVWARHPDPAKTYCPKRVATLQQAIRKEKRRMHLDARADRTSAVAAVAIPLSILTLCPRDQGYRLVS